MPLKCCTHYVSKFRKPSGGHKTGKGQSSSQFPMNAQPTRQLPSPPMLARLCSKSFKLGFNRTWTENFQMFKLDLEKAEERQIKLPTCTGSWRKQGNSRKTPTSASLTTLKPSTVWITTNCRKFLRKWEYRTILPASWETCMQVKKQQLELDTEQQTGSK